MIQFIDEPRDGEGCRAFVRQLILTEWNSPQSPLRLSADLNLADLATAGFFLNTRILLTALAEEEGAATTATGNLTREFVGRMFEQVKIPALSRESIRRCNKVLNEQDLWAVHLLRIVSQRARLIARRKKRFQLTRIGRALLPENQAGALYRACFLGYFRHFDFRSFHFRDVPGIQATMAVNLWRLDSVARDWTPVRGLAPRILLPRVLDEMHETMTYPSDTEEWILSSYLLEPLQDFGLIEMKSSGQWPRVTANDEVRLTALWGKFIRFAQEGGGQ